MKNWLWLLSVEVNSEPYNPTILNLTRCGMLWHLCVNCDQSDVDLLDDCDFQQFQYTLHRAVEMKQLDATLAYKSLISTGQLYIMPTINHHLSTQVLD